MAPATTKDVQFEDLDTGMEIQLPLCGAKWFVIQRIGPVRQTYMTRTKGDTENLRVAIVTPAGGGEGEPVALFGRYPVWRVRSR